MQNRCGAFFIGAFFIASCEDQIRASRSAASDEIHLNLEKTFCFRNGRPKRFVLGRGLSGLAGMPLVRRGVHARKAGTRWRVENTETLDRPLGRSFRSHQEGRVEGGVEPLGDGSPSILSKESRRVQGCRLLAGLAAQAIPPQGQDPGVASLPRGRKRRTILPFGHSTTLSRLQGTGTGCLAAVPRARVDAVQQRSTDNRTQDDAQRNVSHQPPREKACDGAQHCPEEETAAVAVRFLRHGSSLPVDGRHGSGPHNQPKRRHGQQDAGCLHSAHRRG
jgi:hypothetical protein